MSLLHRFDYLPASRIAETLVQRLLTHDTFVVTAPPGAGKSTLLPLALLESLGQEGKILMLEPRRLAARQIAERMATMLGEKVGMTVGYQVRFERKVSEQTRIEVLTEGILTRRLVSDPTLDGVSLVIFDEFHERSLASDVALALIREAQHLIRPDLRIVIMSATIDTTSLCQSLNADLVESEGKMYPVEIVNSLIEPSMQTTQEIAEAVAHQIREAHERHEGDILAFLPGEAEIRRCEALLYDVWPQTHICPLYGMLPPQQQQQAIAPSREGERKVVLATPIAETSLTIEGVRVVVDPGLCRQVVYDPQSGLSHLQTQRISLDMANQRSGRAGRVASGTCYRLWSLATQHRMPPCRTPEILEADLAPMLLDIAAWGGSDVLSLSWLTPPPAAHLAQGKHLLTLLHAIDNQGHITPHGKKLASLPCHPRIGQMMLTREGDNWRSLAADLAALLEERDPLANDPCAGADLYLRIERLRQMMRQNRFDRGWERIGRAAEQYRKMARITHSDDDRATTDPFQAGLLLAAAFPERVACSLGQSAGTFKLANGELASIELSDELSAHDWIVPANLRIQNGKLGKIFLGVPVRPQELSMLTTEKDNISWDSRQGCVVAQRERRIGSLLVETFPLAQTNREEIVKAICEAARKEGMSMFDFNDEVRNLQQRVLTVSQWHPELELPDLDAESVLERAAEWLPLYIGKASSISELRKLDLTTALWGLLNYEQQQAVGRLAPTHIQVPTGSRIRVEYRQGAELPILRVRLQECFGMTDTPRIDEGRRPILMELLSPGFKPVQLTQDLHSFWQGTYFEVRNELRRRYPKHAWPDNPLEAEAVRGVKRTKKE